MLTSPSNSSNIAVRSIRCRAAHASRFRTPQRATKIGSSKSPTSTQAGPVLQPSIMDGVSPRKLEGDTGVLALSLRRPWLMSAIAIMGKPLNPYDWIDLFIVLSRYSTTPPRSRARSGEVGSAARSAVGPGGLLPMACAAAPWTAISARPASTATTFYATGRARETAGRPAIPIGSARSGHCGFMENPELANNVCCGA